MKRFTIVGSIVASTLASFACSSSSGSSSAAASGAAGNGTAGSGTAGSGTAGNNVGGAGAGGGGTGGGAGSLGAGGPGTAGSPTVTCSQAAGPYTLTSTALDASFVPYVQTQGFGASLFAQVPVAVDAVGTVYVGFNRAPANNLLSSAIAKVGGSATDVVQIPDAALGGIAVTPGGLAALVFDPNTNVDARTWAAVRRFDAGGAALFSTDLFHSANLTDESTLGAPATSRFAYLASTDSLLSYFSHTEMIQGTRHQGGYLSTVDPSGAQTVINDWWGSHNLDQRLLVSGADTFLLGLGDAYPKGIFYNAGINKPQTSVIYTLAGNGQGTTNGQLGGLVDLGDAVLVPFITNDSISQTLTPGDWPNIDQTIADQIAAAAANGNKLGILLAPKGAVAAGDLTPVWLDPQLATGAHLELLKSAPYGTGGLTLLAWAETTGTGRNVTRAYYTMIVDRNGGVCQAKTALTAAQAFTSGDDFVVKPDGSVVWATDAGGKITLITLTPS